MLHGQLCQDRITLIIIEFHQLKLKKVKVKFMNKTSNHVLKTMHRNALQPESWRF